MPKLWNELQALDRQDWPKFLKQNYPEIWEKLAWQKVNEWRDNQKNQAKVLGDTPDYSRSLFTLDERASKMVNYAFKKYWQDGLIYKGAYLINWSVGLETAISDVSGEIEYEKKVDPFVTFEYHFQDFSWLKLESNNPDILDSVTKLTEFLKLNPLQVSTVRPETVFGDVAIAIHPLIFKEILKNAKLTSSKQELLISEIIQKNLVFNFFLPFINPNRQVVLVLSEEVDPNFGTGILKITPASDKHDYDIFQKLLGGDFPKPIGRNGKLTEVAGNFHGLTVEEGRVAVIREMLIRHLVPVKKDFLNQKNEIFETIEKSLSKESQDWLLGFSYSEALQKIQELLGENKSKILLDWDYEHNVTICERSKTVVEPLISEEFFLAYDKVAESTGKTLQEHGLDGLAEVEFFTENYKDMAENFLENIHDWCISRDLVWGHKIPVWYNIADGANPERKFYSYKEFLDNEVVSETSKIEDFNIQKEKSFDELRVQDVFQISDSKPYLPGKWVQEEKIFDTWFSSCLWPLSTLDFLDYKQKEQQLLIVHGGDSHKNDQDYLNFLKKWKLSPQDYLDIDTNWGSWKRDLQKSFKGSHIKVIYPSFPDKLNAKYEAWKIWFERILTQTNKHNLNFVGHSLGGNFLIKYFSENDLKVNNLYLIASCINIGDFQVDNNKLSKIEDNCKNITIYHSTDDQIVSFNTAKILKEKLPKANLKKFENRGHFMGSDFNELKSQIEQDLYLKPTTDYERFYPTQEMVTAKEIFYLWIVRMIILGKYFTGKIPFQKVVIHPTILDDQGRKMSKSLGNGLDPVEAIEKYPGDPLRLSMLGGMIPNRNLKMGQKLADRQMQKHRNFGNKIWNVARFLESLESAE